MVTGVWFLKELIFEKFQQKCEQAIEEKNQVSPAGLQK